MAHATQVVAATVLTDGDVLGAAAGEGALRQRHRQPATLRASRADNLTLCERFKFSRRAVVPDKFMWGVSQGSALDRPAGQHLVHLARKDTAAGRKSLERSVELQPTYLPSVIALVKLDMFDELLRTAG